MSPDGDTLFRFLFEHTDVRGLVVHLDAAWRAVLERHDYPPPARALLGQAMAATCLLGATVKFEGSLTLQLQGPGPVSLVLVQVGPQRTLRGLANWRGEVPESPLHALVGEGGRLAITIDPGEGGERYQGIVSLDGCRDLAAALEDYFDRSEQLQTRLWLTADGERAAGMLLQQLPGKGGDPDAWNRMVQLGLTLTEKELLGLHHRDLLRRLFHEEDVRVFDGLPVSFRCSCERGRIERVLRALGPEEMRSILEEEGVVSVNCEFCNQKYEFDAVDVEMLFAGEDQPHVPPTRH